MPKQTSGFTIRVHVGPIDCCWFHFYIYFRKLFPFTLKGWEYCQRCYATSIKKVFLEIGKILKGLTFTYIICRKNPAAVYIIYWEFLSKFSFVDNIIFSHSGYRHPLNSFLCIFFFFALINNVIHTYT